jgi:glycosyltransferase involved in cell wall biosynthesis
MGEPSAPRGISVVIPSWNGRALLVKFLPSVMQSSAAFESRYCLPAEIVIADDASSDDTVDWLRENFPTVN